jgi:hypothetical protein
LTARSGLRFTSGGRWKLHSSATGLRQPDRDGLLRAASAVFALSDVMHFFPDEFTGLGGRCLALAFVLSGPF